MAKAVELKAQNRTTWNSKTIPDDVEMLLDRIKAKNSASEDDIGDDSSDLAFINNTGLKEIHCVLSFDGIIIDCFVITPSGVLYQFNVDITNEFFDFDWWLFALKNYRMVMSNASVKKKLVEFLGMEAKDCKATFVNKGKSAEDLSEMSLRDLFDAAYPQI